MEAKDEKIWFEQFIVPRRSLGPKGFRILMGTIISLSFVIGLFFYSLGAWPITGFFGLDILLIYWAFKLHYRYGKAVEIIRVAGDQLTITRIDHKGRREDFAYSSYWVNIRLSRPPNVSKLSDEQLLEARSHGKGTFFGVNLTQEMRRELLFSLSKALRDCKRNC